MRFQKLELIITLFFIESKYLLSQEGKFIDKRIHIEVKSYVAGLYKSHVLFCTGILLSEKHVITVATCLKRFIYSHIDFEYYYAAFGLVELRKTNRGYSFEDVKIHQDFNLTSEDLPNNIGLITVLIKIGVFKCCI